MHCLHLSPNRTSREPPTNLCSSIENMTCVCVDIYMCICLQNRLVSPPGGRRSYIHPHNRKMNGNKQKQENEIGGRKICLMTIQLMIFQVSKQVEHTDRSHDKLNVEHITIGIRLEHLEQPSVLSLFLFSPPFPLILFFPFPPYFSFFSPYFFSPLCLFLCP